MEHPTAKSFLHVDSVKEIHSLRTSSSSVPKFCPDYERMLKKEVISRVSKWLDKVFSSTIFFLQMILCFFCKTNDGNCSTLVRILRRYEGSSGQCINLENSTVTFSAKTSLAIKERVTSTIQIVTEGGMGKYLGLPETFGRTKRDVFTGLVDRIRQRSHCWSTRFLSGAGKHTWCNLPSQRFPPTECPILKFPPRFVKAFSLF